MIHLRGFSQCAAPGQADAANNCAVSTTLKTKRILIRYPLFEITNNRFV